MKNKTMQQWFNQLTAFTEYILAVLLKTVLKNFQIIKKLNVQNAIIKYKISN